MNKQELIDKSWHEHGEYPPVGTFCEMLDADLVWRKVEILAYTKKGMVVEWGDKEFLQSKDRKFRPIKTEREKFIETFVNILKENPSAFTDEQIADLLYDIGFRAP